MRRRPPEPEIAGSSPMSGSQSGVHPPVKQSRPTLARQAQLPSRPGHAQQGFARPAEAQRGAAKPGHARPSPVHAVPAAGPSQDWPAPARPDQARPSPCRGPARHSQASQGACPWRGWWASLSLAGPGRTWLVHGWAWRPAWLARLGVAGPGWALLALGWDWSGLGVLGLARPGLVCLAGVLGLGRPGLDNKARPGQAKPSQAAQVQARPRQAKVGLAS